MDTKTNKTIEEVSEVLEHWETQTPEEKARVCDFMEKLSKMNTEIRNRVKADIIAGTPIESPEDNIFYALQSRAETLFDTKATRNAVSPYMTDDEFMECMKVSSPLLKAKLTLCGLQQWKIKEVIDSCSTKGNETVALIRAKKKE